MLMAFGVLHIYNLTTKSGNGKNIEEVKSNINIAMRDLEKCQSELLHSRREGEKLKTMPDARKNVISLLLLLRKVEKSLGQKRDFSNECVSIFAMSARIPDVQEYTLRYKDKMFEHICQVSTNDELIALIKPFQLKLLDTQYEEKVKDQKFWKSLWIGTKYQASKLFAKTLERTDIEVNIEKGDYNTALKLLDGVKITTSQEYLALYDNLENIRNFRYMIDGIYEILEKMDR